MVLKEFPELTNELIPRVCLEDLSTDPERLVVLVGLDTQEEVHFEFAQGHFYLIRIRDGKALVVMKANYNKDEGERIQTEALPPQRSAQRELQ